MKAIAACAAVLISACGPEALGESGKNARVAESAAAPAAGAAGAAGAVGAVGAVEFLAREVPLWLPENDCRSCHHNGDGARALHEALDRGFDVPLDALRDSREWLVRPAEWLKAMSPEFADENLAWIQYASGLATAVETGTLDEREALRKAAAGLAARQSESGAYVIEPEGAAGSPATYGTALATGTALRVWETDGGEEWEASRLRARAWLAALRSPRVLDAAAVVQFLGNARKGTEAEAVERALELIRRAQGSEGGWGLFAGSPPEAFDTAMVLLALTGGEDAEASGGMIEKGAAYLRSTQEGDGGWRATTRPPGGDSYAQRVSTTAWALLALLEVD
ncbi:MAG TPA: prenyltransferase/squalene oxidase repeat-containing protein [Verrucomicrobiales bacterium]|nr:prenyltransferase/squalene oxidase repeat-containing protein [Verrucomicrobiales bacterium]